MKFYKNQFNNLLESIRKGEIKALLLYGPDKGEISDMVTKISKQLKIPINQVEYKEVNNESLYNIANSSSLFSTRELIKIQNVTNSITENCLNVLAGDLQNLLVFVADELSPSSSVRKTFETAKDLGVIPCYINDLRESMVIAKNEFDQYEKNIGNNALRLFYQIVGGVKNNIKNEVQKLSNYTNSKTITEEDILSISCLEEEINPDLMCYSYVMNDKAIYFKEIEKLLKNSIEPVWIVRALIRYILNILKVKKSTLPIDIAIKTLTPPIFFKQIPSFKQAVNQVDSTYIFSRLENLAEAEIDLKKGIASGFILDSLINCNSSS